MPIDLEELTAYFSKIAADFSLINGFYELDMFRWEEFEKDLRNAKAPSPTLVCEDVSVVPGTGGTSSYLQSVEGAVAIIGRYNPRAQSQTPTRFMNEMLYITSQVRAYMLVGKQNRCDLMKHLDPRSMRIEKTATMGDNFMGWRMTYRLTVEDRNVLDRTEWAFLPYENV